MFPLSPWGYKGYAYSQTNKILSLTIVSVMINSLSYMIRVLILQNSTIVLEKTRVGNKPLCFQALPAVDIRIRRRTLPLDGFVHGEELASNLVHSFDLQWNRKTKILFAERII